MSDPDLEREARSLADLAEYQSGSIVSRTLLSKASGNVTLFAFDEGESLSEHTAPHDALVLVVDGDLQITLAGEAHRLGQGDVLVMPGGKPHAVRADSRSKMLLVMLRH